MYSRAPAEPERHTQFLTPSDVSDASRHQQVSISVSEDAKSSFSFQPDHCAPRPDEALRFHMVYYQKSRVRIYVMQSPRSCRGQTITL